MAKEQAGTTDWRSQIKRKVGEHTGNLAPDGSLYQPDRPNQESEDAGGSLFDYKLSEPGNKTRMPKVVRFSRKGSASSEFTEKPLIRTPVGSPGTIRPQVPKQQALTLNVPLAPPEASSPAVGKRGESTEIGISNEVILSRLLAGMIDLVFPFLIALIFTLSASYILNFELISTSSVRLGVLFSICFFFLNSFFFLILSGQTPGMYLTDLQLVGEDSKEVSFPALMLRVFLFLPLAVTVLGLFWCVGDPWCRCAHDRISRTRIIPIDPEN
ncbi:MAG: RDD family protein [Acidobacteriota bacterium]|nr:RDD family protein [Acidobacteriota bacterium]